LFYFIFKTVENSWDRTPSLCMSIMFRPVGIGIRQKSS